MFRDMLEAETHKGVPINVDYSRCPYCESLVTEEYERQPTKNGMWIEPIDCEICGNPYTIIYNEDQTFSHIIHDKVKLNINGSNGGRNTMSKLKCTSCGALAHKVVEGTPYCNNCVPCEEHKEHKEAEKDVNDLVISCGCGSEPLVVFGTPVDDNKKEVPIEEGCCATEKKSFWKKLFCSC